MYLLGDFFHAWAGDDTLDAWSHAIVDQLAWLRTQGVALYFMPGNRDFLLGDTFAKRACVTVLTEPYVITLGNERVLLVHGDRYCTRDVNHQRLRRLTRNRIFPALFLRLPRAWRLKIVRLMRKASKANQVMRSTSISDMDVVVSVMINHMQQFKTHTVIHGHTHRPGMTKHQQNDVSYQQIVLSDWDDNPQLLCYNKSTGFYFEPIIER